MRIQLKTVRSRTGSDPISGVTGPDLIRQLRLPVWREYHQAAPPKKGIWERVERVIRAILEKQSAYARLERSLRQI